MRPHHSRSAATTTTTTTTTTTQPPCEFWSLVVGPYASAQEACDGGDSGAFSAYLLSGSFFYSDSSCTYVLDGYYKVVGMPYSLYVVNGVGISLDPC